MVKVKLKVKVKCDKYLEMKIVFVSAYNPTRLYNLNGYQLNL
jgi:hypothetical protein